MSPAQELRTELGRDPTGCEHEPSWKLPRFPASWRNWAAWAGIVGGILVLALLFHQSVRRNLSWFSPLGFDQTYYLWTSYQTHEFMQAHEPADSVVAAVKQNQIQGSLLQWMAGALFLMTGPTRIAALALNFLFFAALQLTLVATLRWATGRWSGALFGLGLLLTAATPYAPCGGLTDFRLDFIAFCLYGIFLCAVMRSRFFESRRWALVAGAVAGFMVVFRYITGVYVAGFLVLCLTFALIRWFVGCRDLQWRRAATRQLTGLLLTSLVAGGVALPFLVRDFEPLWNYYVIHHVIGPEKESFAAIFGVRTRLDGITFYAHSLVRDHAGRTFLALVALSAAAFPVVRRRARQRGAVDQALPYHHASAWFMLLAGLAVPYVVLTADVAKSPVVGNLMVMPLLLLTLLPVVRLARVRRGTTEQCQATRYAVRALSALAVVAVVLGCFRQTSANAKTADWARCRDDANRALALHDEVIRRTAAREGRTAHISFNGLQDYIFSLTIMIRAYEVHHLKIDLVQELPTGVMLMEVDEQAAMQALERSDLVVLTDKVRGMEIAPFHVSMDKLRPVLRAYCERTMVKVNSFDIRGVRFDLYERPRPQATARGS
jgi:hypothetical protein